MNNLKQLALRVPNEVKEWLRDQAKVNHSSLNSEVIRAVRERMATQDAEA